MLSSGELLFMKQFLERYFGAGPVATPSEIRATLWPPEPIPADAALAEGATVVYSHALLEQYKIYVEMADRISARRGLTNSFFLTLNSSIFTALAFLLANRPHVSSWLLIFPTIVFATQSMTWFWLVRSYRQLNSAKYAVVGALEERLPASPYWRAEWKALGAGEDPARYWPISHLEQWVPILFAITYVGGFIGIMAT